MIGFINSPKFTMRGKKLKEQSLMKVCKGEKKSNKKYKKQRKQKS